MTTPRLEGIEMIRTPALILDRDALEQNIGATLTLLGQDPARWRPHLKTAKLGYTMRRLAAHGVRQAKCATTLELETACEAGFEDVLLAYPAPAATAGAVREIAPQYPGVTISVLVEDPSMLAQWRGTAVGMFIDLNSGMNRTGMLLEEHESVIALARAIEEVGFHFAGLHFYDGQANDYPPDQAGPLVHAGYDRLFQLIERLRTSGIAVPEVVTAGTPAFPHAAAYRRFLEAGVIHRVSPGTVVYNDARSLTQLPLDAGYRPAVHVLSRVVSHPGRTRFCCDAGHKTVSADSGDPTCEVVGHPEYMPRHPSEEHLPVDVAGGGPLPARGAPLWLLPRHVCPTVNNFDEALVVAEGRITGLERVTARGRHPALSESERLTLA